MSVNNSLKHELVHVLVHVHVCNRLYALCIFVFVWSCVQCMLSAWDICVVLPYVSYNCVLAIWKLSVDAKELHVTEKQWVDMHT